MSEHQKDPLIQLLELSMADIEQGRTHDLQEALASLKHRPLHPGELLREDVMASLELDVEAFSGLLGVSGLYLNQVLLGKAAITTELACSLEHAGFGTARAWLAMQTNGDWGSFFDTEPASPDFLTEREDVITERGPDQEEHPSETAPGE